MDKGISILILDDEEEISEIISMGLKKFGFNGKQFRAKNLKECVDLVQSNSIDLFILDWLLPDGEGIDLVRRLRSFKQYLDTPIIMMTGREDIASRLQFESLKIKSMLVKPFSLDELRIEVLLNLKVPESEPVTIPLQTKFLIIDDQSDLVDLMAEQLERDGHKFIEKAFSFNEASDKLNKSQFDFLITDWVLKDGTGLDLIKKIRNDSRYTNLPILLITGKDGIDDLMLLHELNIKDHLIKPFRFDELKDKMLECWQRYKKV